MKFIRSLAAVSLPRGAVAPHPLPGRGDLPADIATRGVGRAFPDLVGMALQEVHERRVGGDEFGRGSIGHVTLHAGVGGNLNPATPIVTWQQTGKLPC